MWIRANDVESPESYDLQLPFTEALEVMGGSEDYTVILSSLGMENGELVLTSKVRS